MTWTLDAVCDAGRDLNLKKREQHKMRRLVEWGGGMWGLAGQPIGHLTMLRLGLSWQQDRIAAENMSQRIRSRSARTGGESKRV